MSAVSAIALQTVICYRTFPEVIGDIAGDTRDSLCSRRKWGYGFTLALPMRTQLGARPQIASPATEAFVNSSLRWVCRGFQDHWGATRGWFLPTCWKELPWGWEPVNLPKNPGFERCPLSTPRRPRTRCFHPEWRAPWDFCKILLSCSNGSTLNLENCFVINAMQIVHFFLSYSACLHSLSSLINSFDRKGCFMTLV